jgi:hypothetical protein
MFTDIIDVVDSEGLSREKSRVWPKIAQIILSPEMSLFFTVLFFTF